MLDIDTERKQLIDKGWRRGSVIDISEDMPLFEDVLDSRILDIIKNTKEHPTIAICMTYDCALVDGDFNREPWCQLLIAWPALEPKIQFRDCRSLRTLHFNVQVGDEWVTYECTALSSLLIDRAVLKKTSPSSSVVITYTTLKQLISWFTDRISKPTFPDAWESRFKVVWKALKKTWKLDWFTSAIPAIYIKLSDWGEVDENTTYEVEILIVHNRDGREARDFINQYTDLILQKTQQAFNRTEKISLNNVQITQENQVTLSMLREFQRIYLDEFSHRAEGTPLPSDRN